MAEAREVNNTIYELLGDRWYDADDDPVALLRAQGRLHARWIAEDLRRRFGERPCRVLDVGCGAGFIANDLAGRGHDVTGVDIAAKSLEVAARHDTTGRARWLCADARALPLDDASFDAACAMDVLEHVESIDPLVAEMARVLTPGGVFFFHTFDRTAVSWLVVIKGVEWFVRNVPPDLHVLRLFVKPAELRATCEENGLRFRDIRGCAPKISWPLARMLATGVVPRDLEFEFTRHTLAGYTGLAERA